jgi:hypothetical protein
MAVAAAAGLAAAGRIAIASPATPELPEAVANYCTAAICVNIPGRKSGDVNVPSTCKVDRNVAVAVLERMSRLPSSPAQGDMNVAGSTAREHL